MSSSKPSFLLNLKFQEEKKESLIYFVELNEDLGVNYYVLNNEKKKIFFPCKVEIKNNEEEILTFFDNETDKIIGSFKICGKHDTNSSKLSLKLIIVILIIISCLGASFFFLKYLDLKQGFENFMTFRFN